MEEEEEGKEAAGSDGQARGRYRAWCRTFLPPLWMQTDNESLCLPCPVMTISEQFGSLVRWGAKRHIYFSHCEQGRPSLMA